MSKKKVILSTIAILIVMFAAVSVVSYSIANLGHGDNSENIDQASVEQLGAGTVDTNYITNIDLIIENAVNNGETFNIVEIVPDGTYAAGASGLQSYVTSEGFSKYVLSANKSSVDGPDMPEGKVKYNLLNVNALTALTDVYDAGAAGTEDDITVQNILDSADLIYFSSPNYDSYDNEMNISDDMYTYLMNYSITYKKPIIVDYVTSVSGGATGGATYKDLVTAIERNYIKYRTYPWKADVSAEDFFKANKSYYLKFSVNNRSTRATGKVLVLTTDGTADNDSISKKMEGYSDILANAYYGKDEMKPEQMDYVVRNLTSNPLTVADLNTEYDFIIIENEVSGTAIANDVYNKLKSLSESSKYILYDARIVANSDEGQIDVAKNNYLKLLHLLVNDTGIENYTNVLALSSSFFGNLNDLQEEGLTEAKKVADLIDSAVYRDSATSGAAGKKFRVLEIQPCYPIDTEIAESYPDEGAGGYTKSSGRTGIKGTYYSLPDQVLYGYAKDEVPEGKEYYAFEISKAKISHATGVPYNQIEIDQMSTNQLISTKNVVLENYDLVYIGGDTSALVPHMSVNYGGDSGYTYQNDQHTVALDYFTAFDMYTHTGNYIDYSLTYNKVGTGTNSVTTNGNDLTTIKRDELMDYVDAGLPIIIDKVVKDAFEESYQYDAENEFSTVKANRLSQLELRNIDPDSNMYQFLAYTYNRVKKDQYANVGWGTIDSATDEVQVDNEDRSLGNTIGPNATVFDEDASTEIKTLVETSKERPSLLVSDFPINYVEGNSKTTNTSQTVSFKASVRNSDTSTTPKTYKIELYVDANGDGMYLESERMDSESNVVAGTEVELSYQLDSAFFGLVNWQIKATEVGSVMCDTVTGNAFFKVDEDMKKTVRVLQIMPYEGEVMNEDVNPNGNYIGKYSLYFCTECQQSMKIIKNNVTVNSHNHEVTIDNITYQDAGQNSLDDVETVWSGKVTVGKHEHDFGIVQYDSTFTSLDDWNSNIADALTHGPSGTEEDGDYEFDLDIVTDDEFKALCADSVGRTDEVIADAEMQAEVAQSEYETLLKSPTLDTLAAKVEEEIYKAIPNIAAQGRGTVRYRDVLVEGVGTEDAPGDWMLDREYYKFWELYNDKVSSYTVPNLDALATAYNAYITEYDKAVAKKEDYKNYLRQTGNEETWLLNNYDVIVLGLADAFNYEDLDDASVAQLKHYVDEGGSVLNTHDTLTGESNKGAVTLTNALRETFGMDRFHVTGVETPDATATVSVPIQDNLKESYTIEVESNIATAQTFRVAVGGCSAHWGQYEFTIKNEDLNVNLVTENNSDVLSGSTTAKGNGNVHSLVTESVAVKFAADTSLAGRAIKVYKYQNYNWIEITSNATLGADGTYTFNIAQTYDSKSYATYLDLYKSDIEGTITLNADGSASFSKTKEGTAKDVGADLKLTFNVVDADGNAVPDGTVVDVYGVEGTTKDGVVELTFKPEVKNMETDITLSSKDVVYDLSATANGLEATLKRSDATTADTIIVTFNVTGVDNGAVITLNYGGAAQTATVIDGKAVFIGIAKTMVSADTIYRTYSTKDSSKYFWTERLQAASPNDYPAIVSKISSWAHYNAPLGLSDMYSIYNAMDMGLGQYKYVFLHPESFDHASDVNGVEFEAKYGTRKAEQVNRGGVTFFPFVIGEEMMISPTHSQVFALDLEDPTVAVWYALGSNYIDSSIGVTQEFTRYSSILFAASPRDGMNNYFLYSKDNVFYTGAGHQRVTGRNKNNNDERRLFINVIVNCVTRGVVGPSLKLYNPCDEEGNTHATCDDKYVDPEDKEANDKAAKEKNVLFYNQGEEMYQYNIDESQTEIYPEFDFKAIAGTNDIKKIEVFYDLNYDKDGTIGGEMDQSDVYTDDANHVLIESYDKSDQMEGKRAKMREEEHESLLLKDEYFTNYRDCTYIVVRVQDSKNKWSSARIKINIIPYLFDLTDAGSDSQTVSVDTVGLDMIDKQFNI